MRMANHILLKLNQYPTSIQSSTPSPNDIFNTILLHLNGWLSMIPNLFHSLLAKFDEAIPPETREHWLAIAKPFVIAGLGVVFLCLFCCCCLPAIVSCIVWVVVTVLSLIRGFFMLLWSICTRVFGFCCCCGRRSLKMMKAPGRGGSVIIPRSFFESNPRAYFINLRANRPPVLR